MSEKKTTARKKLTVAKVDLANQEPGFSIRGMYVGQVIGAPFKDVDKKTGEIVEKSLTFAVFQGTNGDRFKVIADAGLKSALLDAMVKEKDLVEVVKLKKESIGKGRTMNQYDIFAVDTL